MAAVHYTAVSAYNPILNCSMMKKAVLVAVLFIAVAAISDIYGQTGSGIGTPEGKGFVVSKGKQNWFFSFGGNANVYMGQEDNQLYFKHRISYGGSLFFGK